MSETQIKLRETVDGRLVARKALISDAVVEKSKSLHETKIGVRTDGR